MRLFYCVQNLLLYKCYGMYLAILGLFVLYVIFFFWKIHIYFQKFTHIFQNIPESQNATHNICRVRVSERNKNDPIILASKLQDL